MTTQITVTIGRNVPALHSDPRPMNDIDWQEFQEAVVDALNVAMINVGTIVPASAFTGGGVWDGVEEESAVIMAVADSFPPSHELWLRDRLGHLRAYYSQDAIALSIGTSELIERN